MAFARPKRLLLLLDNFEQIAPAAPLLLDLLAGCPTLTILVTSRANLHLSGEQEYSVPPLAVPDLEEPGTDGLPDLERWSSVNLFAQRARLVQPGFTISAVNVRVVGEICRRVDGLPLAIELAAARIKLLAPDALLARLDQRLTLLTGGPRDLPDRQRTLRSTIAWSHDLLDEPERILFRTLAVFAGGWTLEAAEAIGGPASGEVLDTLGSLVDKNLVMVETGAEETRYRMLETIREYALECLEGSGESETVRSRHASYFGKLMRELSPEHVPAPMTPPAWLGWTEREQDNLRVALRWAHDQEDVELETWLIVSLILLRPLQPNFDESRNLSEQLANLQVLHGDRAPLFLRIRALCVMSGTKWLFGELSQARELLEEGIALGRAGNFPASLGALLQMAGHVAREQGRYEQARLRFEELLTLSRESNDQDQLVMALLGLADIAREHGDAARMVSYCEECLSLNRAVDNPHTKSYANNNLGLAAWQQGDTRRARELLHQSLRRFQEVRFRAGMAEAAANLGRLARAEGTFEEARAWLGESLILARTNGPFVVLVGDLEELAGLESDRRADDATKLFGAAQAIRDSRGAPRWPIVQATYERDLDAARGCLGDRAFAAAWAHGQRMSMEDAVSLALELAQPLCAS